MENALQKIRKQTAKILMHGKIKVLEDFWPSSDKGFDVKAFRRSFSVAPDPNADFYAESVILYSLLLATDVLNTNSLSTLQQVPAIDEDDVDLLRQKPKYKNMSDDQFDQALIDIVLNDTRNSFAHGNFATYHEERMVNGKQKNVRLFILCPNCSPLTKEDYTIVVTYDSVYKAIGREIAKSKRKIKSKEELAQLSKTDFNAYMKQYFIPSLLFNLSVYYRFGIINSNVAQMIKTPAVSVLIQHVLNSSMAVVNQNLCYDKFGKDSQIFKDISFFRNSTAHNVTTFDGIQIALHNPGTKNPAESQKEGNLFDLAFDLEKYNAHISDNSALAKMLDDFEDSNTKK